jgi:hypothetical protein
MAQAALGYDSAYDLLKEIQEITFNIADRETDDRYGAIQTIAETFLNQST